MPKFNGIPTYDEWIRNYTSLHELDDAQKRKNLVEGLDISILVDELSSNGNIDSIKMLIRETKLRKIYSNINNYEI